MILSKRLQTIADFVTTKEVIDVGCDHALLDIYLTKERNIKCIATDIRQKALDQAKKNIEKYQLQDKIILLKTDGLHHIDINEHQTIIIAGMGTSTILRILESLNQTYPLIISSNNELPRLRRAIIQKGYKIVREKPIFEKKHWYVIIQFQKGKTKYSYLDYEVGPYAKEYPKYVTYLYQKKREVYQKIPFRYWNQKRKLARLIKKIKRMID